jgi:hypothetical protein
MLQTIVIHKQLIIVLVLVQSVVLQPINSAVEQQQVKVKQVEKRSIVDDETSNLFSIQAANNYDDEVEDLVVAETHVFR